MAKLYVVKVLGLLVLMVAAMPSNAENKNDNPLKSEDEQTKDQDPISGSRDCKLKLSDFAGNWVLSVDSVGGVAGPSAVGHSLTLDGQVSFNSHGRGTVNFGSAVEYSGVPGEIFIGSATGDVLVITITDPVHGIGIITETTPSTGAVNTADFVAIFSKETGKVIRLNGHRTSSDPTTHEIVSYNLERQFQ
ncbi:MAG TPA: hypothetical protein VEL47_02855 [Myxococcota bacterium]|nr:hypothetical protein [Myxococcota bacterium]